jgi:hypothetical protein
MHTWDNIQTVRCLSTSCSETVDRFQGSYTFATSCWPCPLWLALGNVTKTKLKDIYSDKFFKMSIQWKKFKRKNQNSKKRFDRYFGIQKIFDRYLSNEIPKKYRYRKIPKSCQNSSIGIYRMKYRKKIPKNTEKYRRYTEPVRSLVYTL